MELINATKETTWYLTVEGVPHPIYKDYTEYRTDDSGECWEVGVGESWITVHSDSLIASLKEIFGKFRNSNAPCETGHIETTDLDVLLYRKIREFISDFTDVTMDDATLDLISDNIMDIFIHETPSVSMRPSSQIEMYRKLRDFLSGYVNVPLDEISLDFLVDHSIDIITLKEDV